MVLRWNAWVSWLFHYGERPDPAPGDRTRFEQLDRRAGLGAVERLRLARADIAVGVGGLDPKTAHIGRAGDQTAQF